MMTADHHPQNSASESASGSKGTREKIIQAIDSVLEPLGYETVHLEFQNQRQKVLRVFIDHQKPTPGRGIGIEDCVTATKALDEPLNALPEVDTLFHGPYELEVSSPGVDRPLRRNKDFEMFSGREIRIHVFRPLTADELGNAAYQSKNPKQKNFLGTLQGLKNEKILLLVSNQEGKQTGKKGKSGSKTKSGNSLEQKTGEEIQIPLALVSKANLEPDFEAMDERE